MPYNFVADSIYTKKLCSRLSLSALFDRQRPFCVFEPPLGAQGQRTLFILGLLESA